MQEAQSCERALWMSALAKASPPDVAGIYQDMKNISSYEFLRRPEIGLVMTRARIGGDGAPFNLGETTVTRCSVRLESSVIGHAYIRGRNPAQAEHAAYLDGLMQNPDSRALVEPRIKWLLRLSREAEDARMQKIDATRVDFFTVVRGEDE